jgi:hypothetical protein
MEMLREGEGKAWYSMCVSLATYYSAVENVVQKMHHPAATARSRTNNANANGNRRPHGSNSAKK